VNRAFLLLAIVALAPSASALMFVDTCESPCDIPQHSFAAVPPVMFLQSGDSVRWTTLDTTHANADGTGVGGETPCFFASTGLAGQPPFVTFTIADGDLFATMDDNTKRCTTPTELPDGSFELPYYCKLHPQMRGVFVVSP